MDSSVWVLRLKSLWAGLDIIPWVGVFLMLTRASQGSYMAVNALIIRCFTVLTAFSAVPLLCG
jgi:hypothetical protein